MLSKRWDSGAKSFFLLFRGKGKRVFQMGQGRHTLLASWVVQSFERMTNVCGSYVGQLFTLYNIYISFSEIILFHFVILEFHHCKSK